MKDEYIRVNLKIRRGDLEKLKVEAEKQNCSLSKYLLLKANIISLPQLNAAKRVLTVEDIITEANKLDAGETFSVPKLFQDDWEDYTKKSKLSASKGFKKVVEDKECKGANFIGRTSSNLAKYEKNEEPILYYK